jgi:pimeloyl-ACP methyl ester carboxylesterase
MINHLKILFTACTFLQPFVTTTTSYLISHPPPVHTPSHLSDIPKHSKCTGLKNEVYNWRGQQIRYLASGPKDSKHTVLLIHGLFVNAATWRHTLHDLGQAGYRTYALDLLGSGYSSKPMPNSLEAKLLNGENGRFYQAEVDDKQDSLHHSSIICRQTLESPIRENVVLGTASGGRRVVKQIDLRHPLNSCYNFYTWAEQVNDFTHDIIFDGVNTCQDGSQKTTSLIANSKGCIVALQACLDKPGYYNGICTIDPTYREMHEAEMKFKLLKRPIVRRFQKFLRNRGHGLYNFVSRRRGIIHKLLRGPYFNIQAIDNDLLDAIIEPLNLQHSSDIVFDELSYSTGPLFEQQLQEINDNPVRSERKRIWVLYGEKDPWLHPKRVDSLIATPFSEDGKPVVDKVIPIENAGHCPHDERPVEVGKVLMEFLETCKAS